MNGYITDISKQIITIEGKTYSPDEINQIPHSPEMNDLIFFLQEWFSNSPYIQLQTSGTTGMPKKIKVKKQHMINSALMTCNYLKLEKGDTALLCMSLKYIGAKMVVVRALVAGLNLIVREATGHPLISIKTAPRFAAMVPLQVYNSIQIPEEKEKLKQIKHLIIGGGAIDATLEKEINPFPNNIYSTYGMTETLSHIALRKLNGPDCSSFYTPFPEVRVSLSPDNTLIINAPLLSSEIIYTHDLAEIRPDGSFRITGRKDNIVNTGGIKVQIEKLEQQLSPFIQAPFAITSLPDNKFGEVLVLLLEKGNPDSGEIIFPANLPAYYHPKHIFRIDKIPLTGNGKIDRAGCRSLANDLKIS